MDDGLPIPTLRLLRVLADKLTLTINFPNHHGTVRPLIYGHVSDVGFLLATGSALCRSDVREPVRIGVNDKYLFVGDQADGVVLVYSILDGHELVHSLQLKPMTFSVCGPFLFSISNNKVWGIDTAAPCPMWKWRKLTFSPDLDVSDITLWNSTAFVGGSSHYGNGIFRYNFERDTMSCTGGDTGITCGSMPLSIAASGTPPFCFYRCDRQTIESYAIEEIKSVRLNKQTHSSISLHLSVLPKDFRFTISLDGRELLLIHKQHISVYDLTTRRRHILRPNQLSRVQFNTITDVAPGVDGTLYVLDGGVGCVYRMTPKDFDISFT